MSRSKQVARGASGAFAERGGGMKDEELEPLVRRTIAGDEQAWKDLWLALDPKIARIAGRGRVTGRLSSREDDRRNVVDRVMERLQADGGARLKCLHQVLQRGNGSGWAWITSLVRHAAIDYTREHEEHLGAGATGDGPRWAEVRPVAGARMDRLPAPDHVIPAIEARRILTYAEEVLPRQQFQALCLRSTGHEYDEIVEEVGLSGAPAARRLVDAAVKHLRYRFARGTAEKENRPGVLLDRLRTPSGRG